MKSLTLEEVSTQQQPSAPAVQCWNAWGISGALTSCRTGYKRSPASFLRLFCKQESHKAPAEAEGDLWERKSFSSINERAQCTFRRCWAGPSQLDGSKGSTWQDQHAAKWKEVQQSWGRTSPQEVSQVQVNCTQRRGVPTKVVTAL